MIGSSAAFTYAFTLVIPAVFFIVGILLQTKIPQRLAALLPEPGEWLHKRGEWSAKGARIIGAVFIIFPGILGLSLMGSKLLQQMRFHTQLSNLQPAEVVSIETPKGIVTSQKDIDRIIGAMRKSDWFLPNHGGWTTVVPLTVRLKSQPTLYFSVAYYLKQEGALVFADGSGDNGSGLSEFSGDLAKALSASGLSLPIAAEDRRHYANKTNDARIQGRN